ncbi:hypothetical protein ACFX11_030598 [Malus domestica]
MLHSSLLVSSGRCGSFSSSSFRTPSAELIVQTAFFSACFFCTLSPPAAGIIFTCLYLFFRQMWQLLWKYSSSGDEYSRVVLDRQSRKGSKQSVPYPSLSGGKNKDKGKDREKA